MTVNQRESELSSLRVSDLENLEKTVNTYYKGLLQAIKACLAVCCSLAFENRTRPLSLMLVTTSGYPQQCPDLCG
jgi:hypothetical protein